MNAPTRIVLAALLLAPGPLLFAAAGLHGLVADKVAAEYPSLERLYQDLHAHPELSLMEEKTSAKIAHELRQAGFEVTEKFGGYGVVGVLKNGPGPTLLIRTDLDGLPVTEETGLAYASQTRTSDLSGQTVGVMQACGHDIHMTVFTGTARTLAALKDHWSGTLVLIGQPAEELGVGARAMLTAGLYRKFPVPDFVHGVGGHGAYPHTTKDPIVLAARIIGALQTIISRETRPIDPAVITVGSIHGGTKHNIIPNEVKLQLTLRSYSDAVRLHTIEAIKRICRGEAIAAGLPEDLMPTITLVGAQFTPATYNDPQLTRRIRSTLNTWLGADQVRTIEAEMGGEDFSEFGRTAEKVPLCLFRIGAVAPEKVAESERTGVALPSLHSSKFAPVPEPTIKTGITAVTAAALDLLAKK